MMEIVWCVPRSAARSITGLTANDSSMQVARMLDDSKKLGFYSVRHGMRVHVVDHDPMSMARGGGLDDVSLVKKYQMTEEDYDKRTNTLRAWKREQLKKNPDFKFADLMPGASKKAAEGAASDAGEAKPAAAAVDYLNPDLVKDLSVGQRCEVTPGARRGEVAYIGEISGRKGLWVGVRMDEPMGVSDGTSNGVRYYECEAGYGSFVRPDMVRVGDFPPRGIDDEDLGGDDEL